MKVFLSICMSKSIDVDLPEGKQLNNAELTQLVCDSEPIFKAEEMKDFVLNDVVVMED